MGAWGDAFARAREGASAAARAAADQAMSSASAAAAAVQHGAQRVTAGAVAVAGAVGTVAGETVNTVGGVAISVPAQLFASAKSLFAGAAPGADKVIARCLGAVADVYCNDYRMSLIDSTFHGADEPRLADAMAALQKPLSPAEVQTQLKTIAELRQRPLDEIQVEYEKYLEVKQVVDDRIIARGLDEIHALKTDQADFMGSVWQLRYGQVVGDKLGVDPVFGALLNPTGGRVGPGAKGLAPDALLMPESVAYHGAYHDAMGYLYNYHNEGPGYNYMKSPIGLSTDNPLAGQATGIAQWAVNLAK